jgi:adenine phosphoribosyltransferase
VSDPREDLRLASLRAHIRDVVDFPKPGILFRDLTPLLADGDALRQTVELLADRVRRFAPEVIVAVESRGFIFGAPVAMALGLGFAPVRKPGKLPFRKIRRTYALEYGTDTLEIHADALIAGARVVLIDDLLATGGTAAAAIELVRDLGGAPVGAAFVVELSGLAGRARLEGIDVDSLIIY